MIDYNDGNWHGWNGGDCPVHPESVVEVELFSGGKAAKYNSAGLYSWVHIWAYPYDNIVKFRVTKPYVEPPKPREFWINEYDCGFCSVAESKADADEIATANRIRCIHVREVTEE